MRHAIPTMVLILACAAPARAADQTDFRTPSDNIHCSFYEYEGQFLACEIRDRGGNAAVLPQPADCDLEWGDRFEMAMGQAPTLSCHGDTIRNPDGAVLDYGETIENHGITCASEKTGLTCQNGDGRGFFLSKAKQGMF